MGDRLRVGDAIALYSSLLGDSNTFTGARHLGLSYPVSWETLTAELAKKGLQPPSPLKATSTQKTGFSDEELKKAQNLLSPIPGRHQ